MYIHCIGSLELRWWKLHGYLLQVPSLEIWCTFSKPRFLERCVLCTVFRFIEHTSKSLAFPHWGNCGAAWPAWPTDRNTSIPRRGLNNRCARPLSTTSTSLSGTLTWKQCKKQQVVYSKSSALAANNCSFKNQPTNMKAAQVADQVLGVIFVDCTWAPSSVSWKKLLAIFFWRFLLDLVKSSWISHHWCLSFFEFEHFSAWNHGWSTYPHQRIPPRSKSFIRQSLMVNGWNPANQYLQGFIYTWLVVQHSSINSIKGNQFLISP